MNDFSEILDQDQIHIVCCCDEKYIPFTATMLMSLYRNHHSQEWLNIYIINNGVSPTTQQNINHLFDLKKLTINWLTVDPNQVPILFGISDEYSNLSCHYYRLLMSYLLPQTIEKVIYLDVDLIILGDISDLWKISFQEKVICATQDFLATCGRAISNCLELGIDPKAKYFNSGVLLIDLKKWREQDISQKVIVCRLSNEDAVLASPYYINDQYGLNVILVNQWQEIDPRWNYSPGPGTPELDPFIVHYYGDVKPWKEKCKEKFRQYFIYYLNQTNYQDYFQDLFNLR